MVKKLSENKLNNLILIVGILTALVVVLGAFFETTLHTEVVEIIPDNFGGANYQPLKTGSNLLVSFLDLLGL
jgi:hypothetical protein